MLTIVLLNAPFLDVEAAGVLSCVDRETRRIVQAKYARKEIRFEKRVYSDDACLKCLKKSVKAFGRCRECLREMPLLTATQSKKTYKLSEDDLKMLNVHEYYSSSYKCTARLFDPHELMTYSLVKYGGVRERGSVNKALEKREAQIKKMNLDFDDSSTKWDLCVAPFLRNGIGGVRGVKARIERYDEFETELSRLSGDERLALGAHTRRLRLDFTSGGARYSADSILRDTVYEEMSRVHRARDLEAALRREGLELRSDSKVCRRYIEYGGTPELAEVVTVMKEMDYLYRNTDYPHLLSSLIDEWKEQTREEYGWLAQEEYEDMFDSALSDLSSDAKRRAMRGKRREDVPGFMWKWLF